MTLGLTCKNLFQVAQPFEPSNHASEHEIQLISSSYPSGLRLWTRQPLTAAYEEVPR